MDKVKAFIAQHHARAQRVSQQTGLPVDVILAQWGLESGWGTSWLAQHANNLGGIVYTERADGKVWRADRYWSVFRDYDAFADDYVYLFLNVSNYAETRDAIRRGADTREIVRLLGASGYDEGLYRDASGEIGGKLWAVVETVRRAGVPASTPAAPAVPVGGLPDFAARTEEGRLVIDTPGIDWRQTGAAAVAVLVPAVLILTGVRLLFGGQKE